MKPIEERFVAEMNLVAKILQRELAGAGFCLLVFDQHDTDGRMNYISNANREDMVVALKEFIANCEVRMIPAYSEIEIQA
jgi:hypothetical protein